MSSCWHCNGWAHNEEVNLYVTSLTFLHSTLK